MKKISKFFASALISVLGSSLVLAGCGNSETKDTSWQNVKNKGELVVGMCAEYPPFESRNEKTNEIEGFDVDIANALGEELGVKVKIVDAQWEALIGGVNKGDYDIIISCMADKEAAAGNVNMSSPYYKLSDIIVVNKDNTDIKTKDDLKGKVVGVQTQTSSEQAVEKIAGIKEIKRYNRNPEAFIDLKNKRIDAVVVGYAYAVADKQNLSDLKIINDPVDSCNIVMVMKKGSDTLTSKINEALEKIKSNGKYDEAVKKWLDLN